MTIKKITIPLLAICLLQISCNKFLDVKPVGRLIPTKVEELENLLNHTKTLDYHFIDNNRGNFYAFLGDNHRISENQATYLYGNTHPNVDRLAAYKFKQPYLNPNNPHYTWEWGIYRAVGVFNNVIDGIESLGESNSDLGKTVTAQAKAGRAWSYLVGTLGYGPMYDPASANDTKVLPFRTSGDPSAPNPDLSTTAELMDLIEADLEAALDAPVNVGNPSRASLHAVYGLRALFYMYKRDWPAMRDNATEAWNQAVASKGGVDQLIYDYNEFSYLPDPGASPTPGTDVEVVLELQGPDQNLGQSYHRENMFYRMAPSGTGAYPSTDFLDNFDRDTDRRYQLFALRALGYSTRVGNVEHDDGIVVNYYRGSKMTPNQGITYPELLLMKAEANARLNDLSQALADLNLLRRYRYSGANTDLPGGASMSQDQLITEILNERRRELPIGTFQRTLDLKRLALDVGKPWSKSEISHQIGSQTYSAPINSDYFTLPISNNIILHNPHWGLPLDTRPYNPAD